GCTEPPRPGAPVSGTDRDRRSLPPDLAAEPPGSADQPHPWPIGREQVHLGAADLLRDQREGDGRVALAGRLVDAALSARRGGHQRNTAPFEASPTDIALEPLAHRAPRAAL